MSDPIVFGAAYSVYVRAVRLASVEKGVPYRLEEIDIFAEGGARQCHRDAAKAPRCARAEDLLGKLGRREIRR